MNKKEFHKLTRRYVNLARKVSEFRDSLFTWIVNGREMKRKRGTKEDWKKLFKMEGRFEKAHKKYLDALEKMINKK